MFDDVLRNLGYAVYADYLNGDHWKQFKERYRASNQFQNCLICGEKKRSLHHVTYERLGEERLDDVLPLCQPHHDQVHGWLKSRGKHVGETWQAIKDIRRSLMRPTKKRGHKFKSYSRHQKLIKECQRLKAEVWAYHYGTYSRSDMLLKNLDSVVDQLDADELRRRLAELKAKYGKQGKDSRKWARQCS